ncbi:hypothetical protein PybrP1_006854 [[Pythium] brassicae (nom. inval.)]|nr:hypothetical protein PybrP1_006854 [[Pythium] brassicae (nom. inval.)]
MFAKESLVQFLAGAGCFSVIQTLLLVVLGAILAGNEHYHQLLGSAVKHAGGGLIFTGLLYLLTAVLGYLSARTQNKFLLLMQFVVLLVLVFLQTLFGGVALGRTAPPLPQNDQVACLTVGLYDAMSPAQQSACDQFTESDAFVGMTLTWQAYYSKSLVDGSYRATVLNLQKESFCCGNGLPAHCRSDSRAFPSTYPSTEVSQRVGQRVKCDASGSAYMATKDCAVGGRCNYDLPYGSCGLNPVTSTTRGCGAFVFSRLSAQVEAIATTVLLLLVFPISFLLVSLCLCFKRRDEDVLPHIGFVSKVKVYAEG